MKDNCILYNTTEFIGKKWTLSILWELYKQHPKKIRYSQIKKNLLKITPKILSSRLKELVKEDLIKKQVDSSKFPIKCEYSLTKSGLEFINIIQDMKQWAIKWKFDSKLCTGTECMNCGFQ